MFPTQAPHSLELSLPFQAVHPLYSAPVQSLSSLHLLPLQVQPSPGTLTQFVGTLVVGWLLFAFTAHVAATYILGDVPWKRALVVGLVPAIVTVALVRYSPLVIVSVGLLADLAAVHAVYRVKYRTAGLVVVMHYVVSLALVLLAANLLALLSTAPA